MLHIKFTYQSQKRKISLSIIKKEMPHNKNLVSTLKLLFQTFLKKLISYFTNLV